MPTTRTHSNAVSTICLKHVWNKGGLCAVGVWGHLCPRDPQSSQSVRRGPREGRSPGGIALFVFLWPQLVLWIIHRRSSRKTFLIDQSWKWIRGWMEMAGDEPSSWLTGLVINCYGCLFVMTPNNTLSDLKRANMSKQSSIIRGMK